MAALDFDDKAAERLEAVYLGSDVVAQREDILARIAVRPGERVLDIGSGPGFLAAALAEATGPDGAVLGVDISEAMVRRAEARNARAWLSYAYGDATALPVGDGAFDVVVSTQVAEYVPDIAAFCSEVHRVLRPGGRALVLATDWDAVCWHSSDPDRMARVMAAFAPHCADPRLPRTLAPRLRAAGLALDGVSYFPIVNLSRYEGSYSRAMAPLLAAYVGAQRTVPGDELAAWAADLDALDARGEYFFSTGRFSFHCRRPDA